MSDTKKQSEGGIKKGQPSLSKGMIYASSTKQMVMTL
jgi:hypothetical protein